MSVLMIGTEEKAALRDLVARAEKETVRFDTMQALADAYQRGELVDGSRNRHLTVELPHDFTVTFTVEEHRRGVPFRHLSVSRNKVGSLPSNEALRLIMVECGFQSNIEACIVGVEEFGNGFAAVNVLEPLDGNWSGIGVQFH